MVAPHPYYFSDRKRWFDVAVSSFCLLLALPVLGVISAAVLITAGRPVFFYQRRAGRNKQPFVIYKFRTMQRGAERLQSKYAGLNQAPPPMFKIFDDPRFVGVGRWLSATGIDELPQLVNILRGEMSLVGPRALPLNEARKLKSNWRPRLTVKPGLFSEWTISSHRHDSLTAWLELDMQTLSRGGWGYDLGVMARTAWKVIHQVWEG